MSETEPLCNLFHQFLQPMEIQNSNSFQLKAIISSLLIVALTITFATAGRILDEEVDTPTVASENPDPTDQAPISGATGGGAAVAAAATVGAAPAATAAVGAAVAGGAGTAVAGAEDDHTFSFFMHDILGGSNPSAIAVTGIVTNPAVSGQVPFAKPNGAVLAVDNGVPTNNSNSGIISNNNIPFLTALSGTTSNLIVKQSNIHVINTE